MRDYAVTVYNNVTKQERIEFEKACSEEWAMARCQRNHIDKVHEVVIKAELF